MLIKLSSVIKGVVSCVTVHVLRRFIKGVFRDAGVLLVLMGAEAGVEEEAFGRGWG